MAFQTVNGARELQDAAPVTLDRGGQNRVNSKRGRLREANFVGRQQPLNLQAVHHCDDRRSRIVELDIGGWIGEIAEEVDSAMPTEPAGLIL